MTDDQIEDMEECSQMFDFTGFTPDEDRLLITEVRRLRALLKRYGYHVAECPAFLEMPETAPTCTCGLDEALK